MKIFVRLIISILLLFSEVMFGQQTKYLSNNLIVNDSISLSYLKNHENLNCQKISVDCNNNTIKETDLFKALQNFKNIEELDINISDSLKIEQINLVDFKYLKSISINVNKKTSMPSSFYLPISIQIISLHNYKLPNNISELKSVNRLICDNNEAFPKEVCLLYNIKYLHLEGTFEAIPKTIKKLINLDTLILQNTNISIFPKALYYCKRIQLIDILNTEVKDINEKEVKRYIPNTNIVWGGFYLQGKELKNNQTYTYEELRLFSKIDCSNSKIDLNKIYFGFYDKCQDMSINKVSFTKNFSDEQKQIIPLYIKQKKSDNNECIKNLYLNIKGIYKSYPYDLYYNIFIR